MGTEFKVDGTKLLFNSPEQATEKPPPQPKTPTEIVLRDADGKVLALQRFVIRLDDKSQRVGVTDAGGKAILDLPSSGKIRFPELPGRGNGSAQWEPHAVQQGEHVEKLAFLHGVDAQSVWNHAKNTELKKKRPTMHQLLPGDVLYLPAAPEDWEPLSAGTSNTYERRLPLKDIELFIQGAAGPLRGARYVVTGLPLQKGEGPLRGTTGEHGDVKLKVPVTQREVTIKFPHERLEYALRIGDLDPHDEDSGARQRLKNLGFLADSATSDTDIAASIRAFQAAARIPVTGILDGATIEALDHFTTTPAQR
jgi:hypothetical protein